MKFKDFKKHIDNMYHVLEGREQLDAEVQLCDPGQYCWGVEYVELINNPNDEPILLLRAEDNEK